MIIYPSHIRKGFEVQTHEEHSLGVARYCAEFAGMFGLEKTGKLIGLLHDCGKGCQAFKTYIEKATSNENIIKPKERIDHSTAGAKYIYQLFMPYTDEETALTAEVIAACILGHHGGLPDFVDSRGQSEFFRRTLDKDIPHYKECLVVFQQRIASEVEIIKLFAEARNEISLWSDKIKCSFGCGDEAFFVRSLLVKTLFSCLIDADRLDTANFMMNEQYQQKWAVEKLWVKFAERLEKKINTFPVTNAIGQARKELSQECLEFYAHAPGVYELTLPTGSGKTLASMRYALAHAKKYKKKKIIVVIPYTSIIDQNADEIRKIFNEDNAILEHHSNIVQETPSDQEASAVGDYTNKAEFKKVMTERWDVPVIFTTMVQFLNTFFSAGTRDIRRMHQLQDSIIIFDEIQTLPIKCTFMFNSTINYLVKLCNSTVVLCTATQPTLDKQKIPLQKSIPSQMVADVKGVFDVFKRVEILNFCTPIGFSSKEIATQIWQDVLQQGNALVIVNKTGQARDLYEDIKAILEESAVKISIVHLSTKMCPAHRKKILSDMRDCLNNKTPIICISTQLIEAGVDISFTTVYRALAGLSSLAQAAGRCNRHGEMDKGKLKIFNFKNEDLSKIEDINRGKDVSKSLLSQWERNDSKIPLTDIFSDIAMREYFSKYYGQVADPVKQYMTKDKRTTIYELLSFNDKGDDARMDNANIPYKNSLAITAAFKEAGREFEVIDSQTISVLVPYGKGKELILALNGESWDKEKTRSQLKMAQQYSVNLFSYEVAGLIKQNQIYELAIGGIMAIHSESYDINTGVKFDKITNEVSIV